MPNVFAVSAAYDLPAGTGLFGGWQIAGILILESGLPLAVTQNTNFNAFAGFGTQRPNRLRNGNLPASERMTIRYFDTEAFVLAPQFTLGNSSRNPVRGPGLRDLDLALLKRTPLKEKIALEFRAEAFNLTNSPSLGNPNTVFGSPGFGSITSAGDPRVLQLALKLHF